MCGAARGHYTLPKDVVKSGSQSTITLNVRYTAHKLIHVSVLQMRVQKAFAEKANARRLKSVEWTSPPIHREHQLPYFAQANLADYNSTETTVPYTYTHTK